MDNKLTIIIDIREDSLHNDIFDRDLDIYKDKIDITKAPLDIGDVHIKYNDILYIFERKTVKDLISSIHDGRYREQKARMLSIYNTIQLSYIIEEDDVISSKKADFVIDDCTFEVGGKGKSHHQIDNDKKSFLVKDDIEFAYQNVIPLWQFGLNY